MEHFKIETIKADYDLPNDSFSEAGRLEELSLRQLQSRPKLQRAIAPVIRELRERYIAAVQVSHAEVTPS